MGRKRHPNKITERSWQSNYDRLLNYTKRLQRSVDILDRENKATHKAPKFVRKLIVLLWGPNE